MARSTDSPPIVSSIIFFIFLLLLQSLHVSSQTTPVPTGRAYLCRLARKTCMTPATPFYTPRNLSCLALPSSSSPTFRLVDVAALADVLSASEALRTAPRAPRGPKRPADTVVLFYGGEWCVWSNTMRRAWRRAAARFTGLCVLAIDAHANPAMNMNLGVHAFPTVLAFRYGNPKRKYHGDRSEDDLVEWISGVSGVSPDDISDQEMDIPTTGPGSVCDEASETCNSREHSLTGQSGAGDDGNEWIRKGENVVEEFDWLLAAASAVTFVAVAMGLKSLLDGELPEAGEQPQVTAPANPGTDVVAGAGDGDADAATGNEAIDGQIQGGENMPGTEEVET